MSAPTLAHPGPGSELRPHRGPEGLALESARRWSVLILAIVGLGLETVSVITVWGQLPALQRGVIVVAVVTAIIAAAFRKTTAALWIFTIAAGSDVSKVGSFDAGGTAGSRAFGPSRDGSSSSN